jgi:hypothetical protein
MPTIGVAGYFKPWVENPSARPVFGVVRGVHADTEFAAKTL